jgi:hypothetical protein
MKIIIAALLVSLGCQTQFTGSPHIDPATCQAKCAGERLVMAGMVYMGEYSSACLCEVPRAAPAPNATTPPGSAATSGAVGAAAGVVMQMRRANAQSQQRGY